MSQIQVDNIYNKEGDGSPSFPLGANVTGVITATTFKGGAEITSGTISATSVTATTGTFTSNVSIGGTLTYEDVTNIDSVGIITARTGVKVTAGGIDIVGGGINAVGVVTATNDIKANGNIVGDDSTNISGISSVTATNFYGNGASLSGIEAAPTIQGVADGSIAAEGATIVTANGKLTAVVGYSQGIGSEQSFVDDMSETSNEGAQAWDENNNQIMVLYRLLDAPATTWAIVGTVSGSTVTWSSTPVQLSSGAGSECAVCRVSSGVYMALYRDADYEYLRVLTVSGTGTSATIALGTALDIAVGSGNSMDEPNLVYDPDNNKVFLAFRDSHDNRGSSYMATVSGTGTSATVTIGTRFDICTSEQPYHLKSCYDTTNNKMIVVWNNSNQFRTRTLSISGSTITGTNMENSAFNGFSNENPAIAYDSVNNCFWASAKNSGNTWQYYRQGKYQSSSDNLVWPGDVTAVNNSIDWSDGSMRIVTDTLGNIVFFGVNSDSSMEIITATFDTSSGSAALLIQSAGEVFASHAGGTQDAGNPIPLSTGRISVGPYRTDTAGNKGVIKMYQFKTSNASSSNFIGFSKEAYTDGQTATVKVVGNVTTQSGLTPGQKYYLQNNGTLSTGADDPIIVVGKALTSTSLLIHAT